MSKSFPAVGQHLFIGIPGRTLDAETRTLLHAVQPGGIVLFARNIESKRELRELTDALHRELPWRPIIAIDQEGGRVNRLRNLVGELPAIDQIKQPGQVAAAEAAGRQTGRWLRQLGIDLNFAPVLDLEVCDRQVANALQERCWGKTAAEVSQWAGAFLAGQQAEGVPACAKHFPGLGAGTQDSHEHLPTITRSREQLLREDIEPYRQLAGQLAAVMVGHGHYPSFDGDTPCPASLSRVIVGSVLRGELGYRGLVVSDDMEMGAIAQATGFEDAVVKAFANGIDMLLVCHTADRQLAAHAALTKAVEQGRLPAQCIIESAQRIREFKQRWTGQPH